MKNLKYINFMSVNKKSIFSKKLSKARKERGLTQEELADELGISRNKICYYELNAKNPSISLISMFSKFFNKEPQYFLLEEDNKLPKKAGPKSQLEIIFEKSKILPKKKQKVIVNTIEGLIKSF